MPWIEACDAEDVDSEDVIRFDHAGRTYAIYLTDEGEVFCTAGLCSHEAAHLAGGILEGTLIECPKHGGLFDIRDGVARGAPACVAIQTYPARHSGGKIEIDLPD